MKLVLRELRDVAYQPLLWLGTVLACLLLIYATGRIDLEEEKAKVMVFTNPSSDIAATDEFDYARTAQLISEVVGVKSLGVAELNTDLATAMAQNSVDIAVMRKSSGQSARQSDWRLTVRARSNLEHRRLVRYAQLIGMTVSGDEPWVFRIYKSIYNRTDSLEQLCVDAAKFCKSPLASEPDSEEVCSWVSYLQRTSPEQCYFDSEKSGRAQVAITGLTADPSQQSRVFIPRAIVLISSIVAFAFACRSFLRDISSNMLSVVLVASGNNWFQLMVSKLVAAVLMGSLVMLTLVLFSTWAHGFHIKAGFTALSLVQVAALISSAICGLLCAFLGRTEPRIYLAASFYLILLVLLSGFIAKIEDTSRILNAVSSLLPVRYAIEPMSDWMLFGTEPTLGNENAHKTFAQLAALTGGAALLVMRLRQRIYG